MAKPKSSNKLDKPIPELAKIHADNLICRYGIDHAELIVKLAYQKIIASKRALERKYGKK